MECSYDVLVELGIRKPVVVVRRAAYLEKRAVVRELTDLLAMPAVREWAGRRGLVLGDFWGRKPLARAVEEGAFQDELLAALRGAAETDRPGWEGLLRGLATLTGTEMTPAMESQSKALSGDIAKVAPYVQMIAPELWDRMHGQAGSAGALTRSIAEANRHGPMRPEAAKQLAEGVYDAIYAEGNPVMHQGFSAAELGKVYQEATKRGLISRSEDPQIVANELVDLLYPLSAVRDSAEQYALESRDVPAMMDVYDRVRHSAGPAASSTDLASEIRTNEQLWRRTGGAGGSFAAALQEAGRHPAVPGTPGDIPLPQAVRQHQQLLANALQSPVMNMAAATVRIGKEIGYRPGSRGEALAKQIASGDMPYLDYEDWSRIVTESGVGQGTAANILNQGTRNRLYTTPMIQEGIRRSQYRYDIAPYLAQLERAFPNKSVQERSIFRGMMGELARSRGYESWENLQQLHGPEMMSRARGIADDSRRRAGLAAKTAPLGRAGFVQRTTDALRDATPKTTGREVFYRMIGAVPKLPELPELEPYEKFSSAATPIRATIFARSYDVYSMPDGAESDHVSRTVKLIASLTTPQSDKAAEKEKPKPPHVPTVAIDLDGTLAKPYEKFDPKKIEDPRPGAKKALEEFQRKGFRIIIFTVRGDKQQVKDWLHQHDMPYDYVNENPDQPPDTSGKVIADVYIDDRAIDGSPAWASIAEKAIRELEKEAAEIEDSEDEEPGMGTRTLRALRKYSPVTPLATLTSGGGPGVGVRIRGTPLITDIDPTGPGMGVGVPPKVLAAALRRMPSRRMKLLAQHIEQLPGKIYLGMEMIGPVPSPFLGAAVDPEDAAAVLQQWTKLRNELKKERQRREVEKAKEIE